MRGVSIGEEWMRLIKGNITRILNAMSNQIPTMISLMLRVITQEARHTEPTVLIVLSSHEVGEEQRQHNQRNEIGYTTTAD
jgi:hypothetical protein